MKPNMDLVGTKVLVAILFGIIRFLFGVFPIKLYEWLKVSTAEGAKVVDERRRRYLDCGVAQIQAFGGGVLFATSFLHMMPEVYYSVEELRTYGVLGEEYPYSQLVVSIGFFLVYFVEEVSHWVVSRMPKDPCKRRSASSVRENKVRPQSASIQNGTVFDIENNFKNQDDDNNRAMVKHFDNGTEKEEKRNNLHNIMASFDKHELEKENSFDNLSVEVMLDEEVQTIKNHEMLTEEEEELIEEEMKSQQQILRCILIVLALSLHAIFEGLAVGLQHSSSNIWYLFIAVSIHSATILFCIGLELVLAGTAARTIVIHMLFLAATSPVGVILGLTISLTTDLHTKAKSLAVVFLEGLSAGTILYITFFEVLSREKERRVFRLRRALCIGAGFIMMAALECLRV